MFNAAAKRYILPFSAKKNRAPFDSQMESAAIFVIAELKRKKGRGLFTRQPEESISFIAKIGYPLWLFPWQNSFLIFDGLNNSAHIVTYGEPPLAGDFLESLQANKKQRDTYITFLSDHKTYFQQSPKERQFAFRGLITIPDFGPEFTAYYKEAAEITTSTPLLTPILEEREISNTLLDLEKLQTFLKADADKLSECLRILNKTTRQYLTELDYEAAAAREEADAKIKAQEEFVKPQIARIIKEYNSKIKDVTEGYDKELYSLYKFTDKTQRVIQRDELKIRQYDLEARAQEKKGHKIYEKRWKDKIKRTEKEISGLRKELKIIENNIYKIGQQKGVELSRLTSERDAEIKLVRQPIIDLERSRNAKILTFRQESNRLLVMEKAIVDSIDKSLKLREKLNANFDELGVSDHQLKSPALFYVPFYVICHESGLTRHYTCIPPSKVSGVDFSAKLKSAFGISKTQDLLTPYFKTVAALIDKVGAFASQNSVFESQLRSLGDKNNLLGNSDFRFNIEKGLVLLRNEGWLSEREASYIKKKITT